MSLYENLRKSPHSSQEYLQKIEELKQKMVTSAVPKKFEEYLQSKNMRIPMFIKELYNNRPA
jgi:DNA-binding transcriptional regulator WhiA